MAKRSNKEEWSVRLVDYSCSSEDDFEPPLKKQYCPLTSEGPSDFEGTFWESRDKGQDDIFEKMQKRREKARRIYIRDGDHFPPRTDDQLLCWEWADWRGFDECNNPEVYDICVDAYFCEESDCRRILTEIDCEDRFIACSIERPSCFFASLNKQEAKKLEAVEGVFEVVAHRETFYDC